MNHPIETTIKISIMKKGALIQGFLKTDLIIVTDAITGSTD